MRSSDITVATFRNLAREITYLLAYEAFADLELDRVSVEGWAGSVEVDRIAGKKIAVVPILRAGLGMLPGVLDLIPSARVNVVGMYRNEETLQPVHYYAKLSSDIEARRACILDPMLATGNSASAALSRSPPSACRRWWSVSKWRAISAAASLSSRPRSKPSVKVFGRSRLATTDVESMPPLTPIR